MQVRFRGLAWLLAWLGACGARGAAPEPGHVAGAGGEAPAVAPRIAGHGLEEARSLELGRGVNRDYEAAARRYAEACDGGRGDVDACNRLDTLARKHRGTALDASADARSHVLCTRGIQRYCDGSAAEGTSCAEGNWEACRKALAISGCETQPTAACFDELARRERHGMPPMYGRGGDVAQDARRLFVACDEGDVDACAQLPGREVPLAARCRANDYQACHRLACEGDATAAPIDRAHPGPLPVPCEIVLRLAKQDREQQARPRAASDALDLTGVDLPVLRADPAPGPITPSATPPFSALTFRTLADRYHGWPYIEVYNHSNKDVQSLGVVAYGYDASGRQVARTDDRERIRAYGGPWIEPGSSREITFTSPPPPATATSFEVCYDTIRFRDGAREHVAGHCPAQKPRGEAFAADHEIDAVRLDSAAAHVLHEVSNAFERAHRDRAVIVASQPDLELAMNYEIPLNMEGSWDARIPLALIPVAIVYNLPIQAELRLSASTIAKIFMGKIARWDDPEIASDNPGTVLPELPVVALPGVHRAAMTSFVCRAVPQECSNGWLAFDTQHLSRNGIDVRTTAGAITFLAAPEARAVQLPAARIKNFAGAYVAPSGPHATQAGLDATLDRDLAFQSFRESRDPSPPVEPIVLGATRKDAYPIIAIAWAYVGFSDFDIAGVVPLPHVRPITPESIRYLKFALRDGQAAFEAQGLGRLPDRIREDALAHLDAAAKQGMSVVRSHRPANAVWVQWITVRWQSEASPEIKRSRAAADVLAQRVLARARAGADMTALRALVPEDTDMVYPAGEEFGGPTSSDPFLGLAESLALGEVGMGQTKPDSWNTINAWTIIKRVAPRRPDPLESAAVLRRAPVAERVKLRHLAFYWKVRTSFDKPPRSRTRAELERLVQDARARLARGEPIDALIARLDPADRDASSRPDEVVAMPGTELGYQRLALRLKVGEVGVVRTASGYHVLVRTE